MLRFNSKRWIVSALCIIGISSLGFAQQSYQSVIHWMNFDDAVRLGETHPKKIFIDVYTPWCGWCKKMDAETYQDPKIIDYINKNFYAVHLDAETADTFHFKGHKFFNPQPHTRGYTNELASSLLDGKMGYPTTVYMDEGFSRLTFISSYMSAADLMPVLHYFVEEKYKTMTFDDYKQAISGH